MSIKEVLEGVKIKIEHLLNKMTLEEKIAQLGSCVSYDLMHFSEPDPKKMEILIGQGIGHISRIGGIQNLSPEKTAIIANKIQRFLKEETRLGIPAIVHEECLSGYAAQKATVFPQMIGVASTWDPELVEEMSGIIKEQMRAVGAHQGMAPVLDISRDPRWGRTEETFGEDPYLVSCMGSAFIKGLQGKDLKKGVVATAKHFLGHGLSEGGRNWAPAHISKRELYEVFARPFEAAIKESNLFSVMNAYNEIDGVPCGVSKEILTGFLRDSLGFRGTVVSDYRTISTAYNYHRIGVDLEDVTVQAINAGLDVELPSIVGYGSILREAVKKGLVNEEQINISVRRILETKFKLGLFENPFVESKNISGIFEKPENREKSKEIAVKSLILLKNDNKLLPLRKDLKSIAVIGPNADSVRNLLGDYSYVSVLEGYIESLEPKKVDISSTNSSNIKYFLELSKEMITGEDEEKYTKEIYSISSILQKIKDKVDPKTEVIYEKGCCIKSELKYGIKAATAVAKKADVALVVLGGKSGMSLCATSGEARDRSDLNILSVQQKLLEAVYQTGTPVVLILINGRPLSIKWAAEHVPAIIEAWVPGEEGAGAVAEVLFGDSVPGGKLPISIPESAGQIPVYYYHKPSGGRSHWHTDYVDGSVEPLFPFGFGLSYTDFEYSSLNIFGTPVDSRESIEISFDLKNIGYYAGDEVCQMYMHDREADVTRPVQELIGFKRVRLKSGECCKVKFKVRMSQFGFYNRNMKFVVEPGNMDIMIGSSSKDIRLKGAFKIIGEIIEIHDKRSFFSDVSVE